MPLTGPGGGGAGLGFGAVVDRGADERGALLVAGREVADGLDDEVGAAVVVGSLDVEVVGSSDVDVVDGGADRPVATFVEAWPWLATATPAPSKRRAAAAAMPRLVFRLPFTVNKIG